jgi:ankyrin repeat protein
MQFLASHGAALDATDDAGRSAIFWAAEYGRASVGTESVITAIHHYVVWVTVVVRLQR